MRVRSLLMTMLFLFAGLGGAAPASAQGLVEYALVLVLAAGPETVIDDFQVPTGLEEDCLVDPGLSPLCDVVDEIVAMSASEAMAVLHEAGAVLEVTEHLDARASATLMSDDCGGDDAAAGTTLRPGTYTVTELPSQPSRSRTGSTRLATRTKSGRATRSTSEVPVETLTMNDAKLDWNRASQSTRSWDPADTVTYTVSDGNGGFDDARRADDEPASCIDLLQSELSRSGDVSMVSDVMGSFDAGAGDDDVVVFVYSVLND